jgi:hypothetical protein
MTAISHPNSHTVAPAVCPEDSPLAPHAPRRAPLILAQGETQAICLGGDMVGHVVAGWLAVRPQGADDRSRLALAGSQDWLGVEWLGQDAAPVWVTALLPTMVKWQPSASVDLTTLLTTGIRQQRRRAGDMLALRSGNAESRCRHLLGLLAAETGHRPPGAQGMPALKDLATLMDLAPETACRALGKVRPVPKVPSRRMADLAQAMVRGASARPTLTCAV